MTTGHSLAVLLAAVGAVLFGIAAVHQHGAVQDTMTDHRTGLRRHLRSFLHLVRRPAWLLGMLQGTIAGGLHIVALALAPITLVQPVGVLAVPVTVVASAVRERRRPSRAQVVGSVLSVGGIAVLTVILLAPPAHPLVVPHWPSVAVAALVGLGLTGLAAVAGARRPPRLRCLSLAVAAAVLFGLNSVLIRLIGHLLRTQGVGTHLPVLVAAVLGLAVALPVGLWAMQSAYRTGTPHVVICALTLVDPITAVLGGRLLLHDGVAITGAALVGASGCALVAAAGVVLLSLAYPVAPVGPEPAQAGALEGSVSASSR